MTINKKNAQRISQDLFVLFSKLRAQSPLLWPDEKSSTLHDQSSPHQRRTIIFHAEKHEIKV
jgi:hypothetical protein